MEISFKPDSPYEEIQALYKAGFSYEEVQAMIGLYCALVNRNFHLTDEYQERKFEISEKS